jgi:hypothetical protein
MRRDGADIFEEIGEVKKTWFELPHGIPSHDAITHLFARIHPKVFQKACVGLPERQPEACDAGRDGIPRL